MEMTSLNPHSADFHCGTRYSCISTLHRFWQRTPKNRTYFIFWPSHYGGFSLEADVFSDFDSFDLSDHEKITSWKALSLFSRCLFP